MSTKLPNRKALRLKCFDYNNESAYFITICTKDRRCLLSQIVGTGVLTCPSVELTPHGKIADRIIHQMDDFYDHISVDGYVIMPNHIHMLVRIIKKPQKTTSGQVGTPVPTNRNSALSLFVSGFKRYCTREYGESVWQTRYFDHIIRNQKDYDAHLRYIDENPLRWQLDELYTP
ncbi:MAG: transposase [Clostridia bacterium]|nr:transposase [Clostridia bacterium]